MFTTSFFFFNFMAFSNLENTTLNTGEGLDLLF